MRRTAKLLSSHYITVARKLKFMGLRARENQSEHLKTRAHDKINFVQFDELQTFEHTKCKPISVALAVEDKTRRILGFQAVSIPATGPLARIAKNKYGPRPNDRELGLHRLFQNLEPVVSPGAHFVSDSWPTYPDHVKRHFPKATHSRVKGARGAVVGQAELKKLRFDPLFSLNHTCAMLRANISRLMRKTWCTTKRTDRLIDHLWLYIDYHNRFLLKPEHRFVLPAGFQDDPGQSLLS